MAPSMRTRLEQAEDRRLALYAERSAGATRRYREENEGRAFDYRTCFQRDRDRIVYSRAFRRLRQKAQTGILPAYEDHRRNRLTHTLEVSQLSRTIARALELNEDLTEAIALGHDLGQPPFGPSGERALDDLLRGRLDGRGGPGLGDLGGFRRAAQSLRVVDRVEKRYAHPGLNLTDPVREGIRKSDGRLRVEPESGEGLRDGLGPSFEAQVVAISDRIAGALHDLDDAMQSGVVDLVRVERLPAVTHLRRKLGSKYPTRTGRFMKANAIHRGLVHLFVTSAILGGQRSLGRWAREQSVTDTRTFQTRRDEIVRGSEIALSRAAARMLTGVEGFLESAVRRGYAADQVEARSRRVLLGLFAAYHGDPTLLEDHVLLRYKEASGRRFLRDLSRESRHAEIAEHYRSDPRFVQLLVDHLSAMTDAFALAEHARLSRMAAVPIPSVEQLRRESRSGEDLD